MILCAAVFFVIKGSLNTSVLFPSIAYTYLFNQ